MPQLANRIQETTTTGGTGTITLGGAVTGYLTFASSFSTSDVLFYTIDNGIGEWEIGIGTLLTTGTLSRDTVIASSNGGALVNFSSGTKRVFCSAPTRALVPDQDSKTGFVLTTDGTDPLWTQTLNGITIGNTSPAAGAFTTLSASSTVSGAGFSTYLASPPAIGGTAPAAGAFTTLSASSTVSGSGFSTYLASPPAIGSGTPAAGAFTTLSASSTVSGSGFSTYLASPPAIGSGTPAAGAFTTLSSSSTTTLNGTTIPASKTLVTTADTQTLTGKTLSGADNTLSNIGNASLTNSAITVNGTPISLGGSVSISPMVYPGAGVAVSTGSAWGTSKTAPSGDLVGTSDSQTLTGKTISGANNTLSAIGNASLTNSAITFGATSQALGSTVSALNAVSIGQSTTAAGAFTTLSASSTVSGTGFSTYLASPPAIGGNTPAAGKFSSLEYTGAFTGGTGVITIGTTQFYKNAGGNVGVGTSTVSSNAKFTVYASDAVSSTEYTMWLKGGAAGTAGDGGGIAFSTASSSAITNPNQAATAIRSLNTYASETNGEQGDLAFYTNRYLGVNSYSGLTERLRLDSSGNVRVGTAALATNATDGFLYIPTCAGTPTGTPTAFTGRAPMVIDSTNNKMYIYSGGSWVALN